jgi:sortase A|tara:strand:- start:854 stop:1447 length:594 start_codon:yes stop_codon:yes gene_type:complete
MTKTLFKKHQRLLAIGLSIVAIYLITRGGWILAKAELAQVLLERSWRGSQTGELNLPWPWADTWPVARLQAAAKNVDLYVLAGTQGNALAFGPGHDMGSVLPGDKGFSVVGGHRDTHFKFLQQLTLNDEMWVSNINGAKIKLRVREITVVDTSKYPLLTAPPLFSVDGRMLTLITCYPFTDFVPGGPLRYVVTLTDF